MCVCECVCVCVCERERERHFVHIPPDTFHKAFRLHPVNILTIIFSLHTDVISVVLRTVACRHWPCKLTSNC